MHCILLAIKYSCASSDLIYITTLTYILGTEVKLIELAQLEFSILLARLFIYVCEWRARRCGRNPIEDVFHSYNDNFNIEGSE